MGTVKYTGSVASFHCPTNATIRSLKVHFSPKQLGEGDPSPENVREIVGWDGVKIEQSSKNLFDANNPNIIVPNCWVSSSSGNNKISPSNADRTLYISCLPNTTYTISKTIGNVLAAGYTTDLPASGMATYSYCRDSANARQVTITTGSDAKYIAIWFYDNSKAFDKTVDPETIYRTLQVEYGSTATLYESYQGSTTNYEFGVLGKNKFNPIYKNSSQYTIAGAYGYYYTEPIYLIPNTTYTIQPTTSGETEHWYWAVGIYTDTYNVGDKATFKYVFNNGSYGADYTFTTGPSGVIRYATNNKTKFEEAIQNVDIQLELGSTATTYEPYDPNHTVYGGWVDLITGEVSEQWKGVDLDTLTWIYDESNSAFYTGSIMYKILKNNADMYCNMYPTDNHYVGQINKNAISSVNSYGSGKIFVKNLDYTTVEDFVTSLDGTKLIFPLRQTAYNTYQLAPISMQTFLGQNNVWSNADYVEVEYDLHETEDILRRKQFIIANQPHIESASGNLVNFNTDMVAKLKSCKIYFEPKQEGSGDPSPDNIRLISGWDGVETYHGDRLTAHLPAEYQEVEYIKTPGPWDRDNPRMAQAYICTQLQFSNIEKIICKYKVLSYTQMHSSYSPMIIESHDGSSTNPMAPYATIVHTSGFVSVNPNATSPFVGVENVYTIVSSVTNKYMRIGGWADAQWTAEGAYYYVYAYGPNDSEIAKFIPCYRKSDNIAGMYETISNTFYPSDGNENFIAGPECETNDILTDWSSTAGTIYGGYMDLVTGEVVQTWISRLGSEMNVGVSSSTDEPWVHRFNLRGPWVSNTVGYENGPGAFEWASDKIPHGNATENVSGLSGSGVLYIYDNTISTVELFKEKYADTRFVYQLRPTAYKHYTIDPATLKTLRGTNNIWSNANSPIEVQYWTH